MKPTDYKCTTEFVDLELSDMFLLFLTAMGSIGQDYDREGGLVASKRQRFRSGGHQPCYRVGFQAKREGSSHLDISSRYVKWNVHQILLSTILKI